MDPSPNMQIPSPCEHGAELVEELVENRAELVVEFVEALQRLLCARWLGILR